MKLTELDLQERYDEMLDEIYGDVSIAGLNYCTSNALKRIDMVAYNEGFSNWLDSELGESIFERNGEYYDSELPDLSKEKKHMLNNLVDIVSELKDMMLESPKEYTEAESDAPSIDIRLCVDNDSSWIFRTGLSDYDPYHSDYCGASCVTLETNASELLNALVDDINNQISERE